MTVVFTYEVLEVIEDVGLTRAFGVTVVNYTYRRNLAFEINGRRLLRMPVWVLAKQRSLAFKRNDDGRIGWITLESQPDYDELDEKVIHIALKQEAKCQS